MGINWVGWILSIVVILLLFAIAAILENPAKLLVLGKRAKGIVIGMDTQKELIAPIVQFETTTGEKLKVSGRCYSASSSVKIGDTVTVLYDPAEANGAQLLLWREFIVIGVLLGFVAFILLLWISGLLIDPTGGLDDPLHILSTVISKLKLSPTHFPIYFMLPVVIFSCGLGTYVGFKSAIDLRANGIKVMGRVEGSSEHYSGSGLSGSSSQYAMVQFTDQSGETHSIKRSLARPLSRLKDGDEVEVIYSPGKPKWAVVNTWDEIWFLPTFMAFMLLAFISMFWLILTNRLLS